VKRQALLLAIALLAGCGGSQTPREPAASLDCAYPLAWNGVEYEVGVELPKDWERGRALGPGVVLGCGSDELGYHPDEDVEVRSVEGIDSNIAVAALLDDAPRSIVWVAPGYLIESPRHPMHEALAPSWGYAELRDEFTCKETLRTRARSLTTPQLGQGLEVVAVNPAVEALLVGSGNRYVAVDPATEISGFDRNGVPYVAEGDELMLVVSICSDEDDPVPGGPLLLAESVRKI
jgi:hypothetical protein